MSEQKTAHTPGPWSVSLARTVDGTAMVVGGEGKEFGLIAECTLDADARLIAAAPDLLEALRKAKAPLQLSLSYYGGNEAVEALDAIRAAIAKAEGRPNV